MSAKRIFVFSVTGAQGRAVALALQRKGWTVAGLTRDPSSPIAQELSTNGITLVKGDLDHPETYASCLDEYEVVFLNTDFFASYLNNGFNTEAAMATEVRQGISAIDACQKSGVKHVIYSALEQFPGDMAVSFTASYDKASSSYQLSIPLPDTSKFFCFDVEQLGDWVINIVEASAKYIGMDVHVVGDKVSPLEVADTIALVTGKPVNMTHVDEESFYSGTKAAIPSPVWRYMRVQHEGLVVRDLAASREVNPKQNTFARWVSSTAYVSQLQL